MKTGSHLTRRNFLVAAGAGIAATTASPWVHSSQAPLSWEREVDMIIVGSGAAAFSAAVSAIHLGNSVLMLEKAQRPGGTTAKSGGGFWVPNNHHMRRDGFTDPRPDALKYMARCSFPTRYNPDLPMLGLAEEDYQLLEAYYDSASVVTEELETTGAFRASYFLGAKGDMFLDYFSHLPEDKAPRGRCLCPAGPDGKALPVGAEMIRQMHEFASLGDFELRVNHPVQRLVIDESDRVIGVVAEHNGQELSFKARKGVIFGTGGFSQNPQLSLNFLRGPIFGGCAVPTNTGDFVAIASAAGAALGNMNNAWWAQIVLEEALKNRSVATDAFNLPGDSTILVNRYGRRVVNEKMVYNERTQAHFYWDPVAGEFPNLLLFMVYDQRTVDNLGERYSYPVAPAGSTAPHIITGTTLAELEQAINLRLNELAGQLSAGQVLDAGFGPRLEQTIDRFNGFAEHGVDEDFHRGSHAIDQSFQVNTNNGKPNPTLYPISGNGPYYCVILAAGTLDTKGGPRINQDAQVVDSKGMPIAGLYGAGNCIASPAAAAYWSGGATIGPALTFGYLAAQHANTMGAGQS
jgi:3-oxosteroid 1-dehydrogenase